MYDDGGVTAMPTPGLREIALKIVSSPDFGDNEPSMARALDAWRKALTPEQWRAAAEALMCNYLLDIRAEYERNLPAVRRPDPQPPRAGGIRFTEADEEPADDPDDTPPVVLRHSSTSDDWHTDPLGGHHLGGLQRNAAAEGSISPPPVPDEIFKTEQPPGPLRRTPPPPSVRFGPVTVSHVDDRAPAPESTPVQVHQDGWKVPAFRNMKAFPSLANRVTVGGVATREGELTKELIPLRLEQVHATVRSERDKDTHIGARVDRRNELNRQDEAQRRVHLALIREAEAEAERLTAVGRVLPDGATIAELDPETLAECGYQRRTE